MYLIEARKPYRNKTYIAFDGKKDIWAYNCIKGWKDNSNFPDFSFHNAHDLNMAYDTSLEESIKKQLKERFKNSKAFILLLGESTKFRRKFVTWEVEVAISLNLPIIVIDLPRKKPSNPFEELEAIGQPPLLKARFRIPTFLSKNNGTHHQYPFVVIPFKVNALALSLNDWPSFHKKAHNQGYYYTEYPVAW